MSSNSRSIRRARIASLFGIAGAVSFIVSQPCASAQEQLLRSTTSFTAISDPVPTVQRFTVASKSIQDSAGQTYAPSRTNFTGGYGKDSSYRSPVDIQNTQDDSIYRPQWVGATAWRLPVSNGTYRVTLKMREAYFRAPGQRVFDVSAENLPALRGIDIFASAGRNSAYDRAFTTAVQDGELSLGFKAVVDYPLLSAIIVEKVTETAPPPPTTSPNPVMFVPEGGAESDQSAALQRLLNSGALTVSLGNSGTVRASVVVPAGVTLISTGATLTPPPGARYVVASGGDGAKMVDLRINATIESSLVGGETGILVRHSAVVVRGLVMQGNGFRYGVSLESAGETLRDVSLTDSSLTSTSYGVYKNNLPTQRLRIERNRFTDIQRGDAIELNMGGDPGVVIADNVISGVSSGSVIHAGLGIGIAGVGSYGQPESQMSSGCTIERNNLAGVEMEAIHLEVMAGCRISQNRISGSSTRTQVGIALYGSVSNVIDGNAISGAGTGIFDALGVSGGQYIKSSNNNRVTNNSVSSADSGIRSMVTGDGTTFTATGNTLSGCSRGLVHEGSSQVVVTNNTVRDSVTPYTVDLLPNFAWPLGTSTRSLAFTGNSAYTGTALLTTKILALSNASGAAVTY